jgi:hypothetical protein
MRQIKFRGRRIDNGKWITGDLVGGNSIIHTIKYDNPKLIDATPNAV